MKDESVIDTTILVYAFDKGEKEKRAICHKLIKAILKGRRSAVITNQILAEFFSVTTTKIKNPYTAEKSGLIVDSFVVSDNFNKLNYDFRTVGKAIEFVDKYKISFWDALIAATMIENNVFTIYTENERDFKKIPGLKVINPFRK